MWRNKRSLFHRVTSGFMACMLTTMTAMGPFSALPTYATENLVNLSYQNVEKEEVQIFVQTEAECFSPGEEASLKVFVQNNSEETLSGGVLSLGDPKEVFEETAFTFNVSDEADVVPEINENGNIANISIAPGEVFEAEMAGIVDEDLKITSQRYVNFVFKAKDSSENEVAKLLKYEFNTGFVTFQPVEFADGNVIEAGAAGTMTFRIVLNQEDYDIEVNTGNIIASDSDADIATWSNTDTASDSDAELATDSDAYESGQELKKVDFLLETYEVQFQDVKLTDIQTYQTMNGTFELEAIAAYTVAEDTEVGNHFGTVEAELKVGKKTYHVSQVFEYEVEEGTPKLTAEQMAQVQNVIDMIAKLPTMEEYFAATDQFFFDDDTMDEEGFNAYIYELARIAIPAFEAYWALNDAQRALIPAEDVEKLVFIYGLCEGVTFETIMEDYNVTDLYYDGLRREPEVKALDFARSNDNPTVEDGKDFVLINEAIDSAYGANGLVIGLEEADKVIPFFEGADDNWVSDYGKKADGTIHNATTFDDTDKSVFKLTDSFGETINALVIVGDPAGDRNRYIKERDIRDKFGVIYQNVGMYNGKKVDLKVTVSDYAVMADNRFRVDCNLYDAHNAVIGLYTTTGKPGVVVHNVAWVTLKYEFFESGTNNPISVKGNTTYYDIDESQCVFVDDTCQHIYITDDGGVKTEQEYKVNSDGSPRYNDDGSLKYTDKMMTNVCTLGIGWFDNGEGPSGYGLYATENYGRYEHTRYTGHAFTESFDVPAGEEMFRTFSFRNREPHPDPVAANYYNLYPEYNGEIIQSEGHINNSGLPVIREGSLYIKKNVSSGTEADMAKKYDFEIVLNDSTINDTYGDLTFTNGKATFTLAHNEGKQITSLPLGSDNEIGYTITEKNHNGYNVKVNGTAGDSITGTITPDIYVEENQIPTITFDNARSVTTIDISKDVIGNSSDMTKQFQFAVTVKVDGSNYTDYTITKGSTKLGSAETFTLAHNESVTVNNVPVGAMVTVTEANQNYEASIKVDGTGVTDTDTSSDKASTTVTTTVNSSTVEFTNKRIYTTVDISKKVTGNLGDWDKEFEFSIQVTENGAAYTDYNLTSNGSPVNVDKSNGKFTLKHNQTVTVNNVPLNASVVIKEVNEDYKVTSIKVGNVTKADEDATDTSAKVTITAETSKSTVEFTNHKDAIIDTGILLDSAPYILTLGIVFGGIAIFVINKRKKEEDLD